MRKKIFLGVILAVAGSVAMAGDIDVEGLRARLQAQEALMNDIEAKMASQNNSGSSVEGLTTLRKNAAVTVGGLITVGYYGQKAKVDSALDYDDVNEEFVPDTYRRRANTKAGSLELSDAEVYLDIQVNDHFEAFALINLHTGTSSEYGNAEEYWVRWKNICDSGFGLKVGRARMVFGESGYGYLDSWAAGDGDGISWLEGEYFDGWYNLGQFGLGGGGGTVPMHNGWKRKGVVQVTPYWEGLDGKLTAEVSFMQNVDSTGTRINHTRDGAYYRRDRNGTQTNRSRNDGFGTMSARVAYTPIEDLKLTASVINYYNKTNVNDDSESTARNNTAFSLAASYRPCFFNRLNVWGQWIHGWNVANFEGLDSDVVNFGASYDILENLTFFAQGDYLRSTYKFSSANTGNIYDTKGTGWSAYAGLTYEFPYGVVLETGWKHEEIKYDGRGRNTDYQGRYAKFKGDMIYANVGFEF